MKISNRVKRNISFALMLLGIACIAADVWDVAINPSSGWAWFELCGMILLTYLCFDNVLMYRRRLKNGKLFGPD